MILASLFWQGTPLKTVKKEVSRPYFDKERLLKQLNDDPSELILRRNAIMKGLAWAQKYFWKVVALYELFSVVYSESTCNLEAGGWFQIY